MRLRSFSFSGSPNFTPDNPLLLLHIFKTAGSSLRLRLERSLDFRTIQGIYSSRDIRSRIKRYIPEEQLRDTGASVYYGHMFHGAHRVLDVPPTYGVFLRSGIDRALSQYAHSERFSTSPPRSLDQYLNDGEMQLDNLMTRMISGHRAVPFGEIRRPHLDAAKRNLDSFCFVGVVEQMNESVRDLEQVLGVQLEQARQVNVNQSKTSTTIGQPISRLEDLNWADRKLYEYATMLRQSEDRFPASS